MKPIYLAHVVEMAVIAFLCLYIFVLTPLQSPSGYSRVSSVDLVQPPDLKKEINSTDDIFADLTSLGCQLVNTTSDTYMESRLTVSNYSDFRRIAYNTKLIFFVQITHYGYYYGYQGSQGVCCFTLYEGFPMIFAFVEK